MSSLFKGTREKLHEALNAADVKVAFGGFDVSVNEHEGAKFEPHYQPHAVIFLPLGIKKAALRGCFPKSKKTPRPVMIKVFDGNPAGLAYALKPDFVRRITLPKSTSTDGSAKRRNTRNRDLRASQKVELWKKLDRIGLQARLFLHGVQIEDTPKGPAMVRRSRAKRE